MEPITKLRLFFSASGTRKVPMDLREKFGSVELLCLCRRAVTGIESIQTFNNPHALLGHCWNITFQKPLLRVFVSAIRLPAHPTAFLLVVSTSVCLLHF